MNVAFIDRLPLKNWYSYELAEELGKLVHSSNGELYLLGPKNICSSSMRYSTNYKVLPAWTEIIFPIQLFKLLRNLRINKLHIQFEFVLFKSPLSLILLVLLIYLTKLLHITVVVTLHGPFIKQGEMNKIIPILAPENSALFKIPLIVFMFLKTYYMILNHIVNKLIVHAECFKRILEDYGIPENKISVIPHGIKINQENKTLSNPSHYFLYFGSIAPRNGLDLLLDSFSEIDADLNSLNLVVAGNVLNRYNDFLKKILIKNKSNDNIKFLGQISSSDLHKLFNDAECVILPYRCSVSASGILSDVIEHNKPVIVPSTEYFCEFLTDGENSTMVPPGDKAALSSAILYLLKNPEIRQKFSKNIASLAEKYSWSNVAKKTYEIYTALN